MTQSNKENFVPDISKIDSYKTSDGKIFEEYAGAVKYVKELHDRSLVAKFRGMVDGLRKITLDKSHILFTLEALAMGDWLDLHGRPHKSEWVSIGPDVLGWLSGNPCKYIKCATASKGLNIVLWWTRPSSINKEDLIQITLVVSAARVVEQANEAREECQSLQLVHKRFSHRGGTR